MELVIVIVVFAVLAAYIMFRIKVLKVKEVYIKDIKEENNTKLDNVLVTTFKKPNEQIETSSSIMAPTSSKEIAFEKHVPPVDKSVVPENVVSEYNTPLKKVSVITTEKKKAKKVTAGKKTAPKQVVKLNKENVVKNVKPTLSKKSKTKPEVKVQEIVKVEKPKKVRAPKTEKPDTNK